MFCHFYRSLDREIEILGLKGKWLVVFLLGLAASAVFALVSGMIVSTGVGLVSFVVLLVVDFLVCLVLQGRLPSRQVDKARVSGKCGGWVQRRETLSRILLEDPRYARYVEQRHSNNH